MPKKIITPNVYIFVKINYYKFESTFQMENLTLTAVPNESLFKTFPTEHQSSSHRFLGISSNFRNISVGPYRYFIILLHTEVVIFLYEPITKMRQKRKYCLSFKVLYEFFFHKMSFKIIFGQISKYVWKILSQM